MDSLLEALQSGAAFRRKRGPRQGNPPDSDCLYISFYNIFVGSCLHLNEESLSFVSVIS